MDAILSSIMKEVSVFYNPSDLSACQLGRDTNANYLHTNICFFYSLDKFFARSFTYIVKDNPRCSKYFE